METLNEINIKNASLTIMVGDMDRSISFYQSIGLTLKNRWGDHYAEVAAPGMTIGLHPSESINSIGSGNVSIGFTTDNFEEVKLMLNGIGIEVQERNEEGGQFLHFMDPDGTMLYFIKPKW